MARPRKCRSTLRNHCGCRSPPHPVRRSVRSMRVIMADAGARVDGLAHRHDLALQLYLHAAEGHGFGKAFAQQQPTRRAERTDASAHCRSARGPAIVPLTPSAASKSDPITPDRRTACKGARNAAGSEAGEVIECGDGDHPPICRFGPAIASAALTHAQHGCFKENPEVPMRPDNGDHPSMCRMISARGALWRWPGAMRSSLKSTPCCGSIRCARADAGLAPGGA